MVQSAAAVLLSRSPSPSRGAGAVSVRTSLQYVLVVVTPRLAKALQYEGISAFFGSYAVVDMVWYV